MTKAAAKTKSFREVREDMAERMGDSPDGKQPCIRCKTPTPGADLSLYGARCRACYEAYCRLPMAQFNAAFKHGEPTRALPRRTEFVPQGHIGALLAKRPTREEVARYADELGIDVGGEA